MTPRSVLVLATTAIVAGAALMGFAATSGRTHASAKPAAYTETAPCSSCPAGVRLDSVEVQARASSTLFIVRGAWPSSVDTLSSSIRLVANDTDIIVKPHGSNNAFEVTTATRAGAPLPAGSVAGSIQHGALLLNVSPALTTPLSFEVGLWNGSYTARLPRAGRLEWTGLGRPTAAAPAPVVAAPRDVSSLAGTCTAIFATLAPAPYLQLAELTSMPPTADPRTHVPARKITAGLGGSALDATMPFSMIAVIAHGQERPLANPSRIIDGSGTEQLYLTFDGTRKHKGIRTLKDGRWSVVEDAAAGDLTYDLTTHDLSFYWTGLQAGDRFGFVTAAGGQCRSAGLDQALQPQQAVR